MAVQAQYGGGMAAGMCLPDHEVEAQMRALQELGAMFSAAGGGCYNNGGGGYDCAAVVSGAAQSELTCNNGGGGVCGGAVVMGAGRKREREVVEQYAVASSSAALLPIPGMMKVAAPMSRLVESAMTSTSGRSAAAVGDALVSELCMQSAEIDAVVRMECERMRAGLEQARKRQCQALVRAASVAAARRLREKEVELEAARRRAAELEERLRQAAAESQAWFGLARSNEAVAAGLRATLDHLLLRAAAPAQPAEGFGDSDPLAAADDAQSCCFETNACAAAAPTDDAATSPAASKWSCKSCGEGDATVLLLPCRHLCLCKACEPKLDACPVCLAAKNASVHIAIN